ncbi:MAG TPA: dTMP kinase [Tepidisphaeraceae bacterium]|jgi:dTMP kinase|nr:dTMP kinase [Tepidisphaeraceae bacterium]
MTDLKGKFIVFDGGEGCGKSTQAAMLADRLSREGHQVKPVHDPGTTNIGQMIRQVLLNPENTDMAMRCEMLLYMASRAQMMIESILPALEQGMIVISDRFVSSTLAYQLGGDGLTAEEIRKVADIAIKSRWPDLTFILDMPTDLSSARVQPKFVLPFPDQFKPKRTKDRIEQRSIDYHEQVRKNYLDQAKADPKRYRVIDATQAKDEVHEKIYAVLAGLK